MPATSKKQAIAMRMALAARKGDLEVNKLKGAALEIYKSDMTNKEIEDFTVLKECISLDEYTKEKNMKDLSELIKESIVNEGSTQWKSAGSGNISKGIDDIDFTYTGNKKYGFLTYLVNEETVCLTAANSAEDFANAYSYDSAKDCEYMFDLKVGESTTEGDAYTMRIW